MAMKNKSHWIGVCLSATFVLLAPASALAQTAVVEEPPPPEADAPPLPPPQPGVIQSSLPRFRFEVGLEGGGFVDNYYENNFGSQIAATGGGGLYVRFGAQFTNWFSAQLEGSAAYVVTFLYLRSALTANFTPVHWFTVSAGPVVGLAGGFGAFDYAGLTLRTDFHLYQYRTASGRRHSLTLGVAGDFGGDFNTNNPGSPPGTVAGGMLCIGYTLH